MIKPATSAALITDNAMTRIALTKALTSLLECVVYISARKKLKIDIVMIWLSIVYRVGPSRSSAKWRWVTWGSGLAAILLVVGSIVFSRYLAEFNSYDRQYGSLGAVVGFMSWLWISIVVMLLGAEVDAAIESKLAERSAAAPD